MRGFVRPLTGSARTGASTVAQVAAERSHRGSADGSRKRWWQVAAVVGALLVAAVAVSSQLGSNGDSDSAESAEPGPETSADAPSPDEAAAPAATAAAVEASVDSEPPASADEPTGTVDESGTELSEAFGEPEHPVSGVEPYVPSRVRLDEPGPPRRRLQRSAARSAGPAAPALCQLEA